MVRDVNPGEDGDSDAIPAKSMLEVRRSGTARAPEILMMPTDLPDANDPGAALGRIPSGLFILTATWQQRDSGMLVSWVQQAGFLPLSVTVGLRRDRPITAWVEASGRFTLSQLASDQKNLLRHFARGFEPDEPAFSGVDTLRTPYEGLRLTGAMAYLDATVEGSVDSGDHRIFLGRILGGAVLRAEAEPRVHIRQNGSHY